MDGVFILDSEPLEVGMHLTFSLRLGNETVAFQGIVQWFVPQEGSRRFLASRDIPVNYRVSAA